MSEYTSRMQEHLEKRKKKQFVVILLLVILFFVTVGISSLKSFELGKVVTLSEIQSLFIMSFLEVALLPLIHIAIASIWASKRNYRSRRNIILGWLLYSCVANLFFIYHSGKGELILFYLFH
jgi:hypothetical protein